MADKENAAPAAAAGPRLTRAAAKRAATCSAGPSGGAKRKRVALSELPIVSNAGIVLRQPSKPAKPAAAAEGEEEHGDVSRCASTSPTLAREEVSGGGGGETQLSGSYASDIYTYLRTMEVEAPRRPAADYIEAVQTDVTANMRAILIDWLVEVAEEYKLVADTLYLTVSYVDRFLSANPLGRNKLQLLGVAAMLIASKYEEISPPHVEDFCYITDNTYTRQELLTMESDILKLLNFEIGSPTIKTFLRRFTRSGPEDKKRSSLLLEFMGSYLAELSLLDYSCLRFLPSVVAASSLFLARLTIGPDTNPWGKEMHKLTGYKASELKDCIIAIHDLQLSRKGPSLPAIRDKYKQHRFKCVSMLLPPVEIPALYFQDLTE
ncbi:cyclin-A3-2-like [Triticum dicoccoides]|uniref:cyclin-A3-2-like n=1 Tax=Triticum dicoccoides TaxID=85692 RepID=UPI000E7A8342|nr:cyclin-A3-2-like [Triticum dicoccoides]